MVREPLCELPEEVLGDREITISRYIAELDSRRVSAAVRFCGISRGLMDFLTNHKNLGIHTEIFTDPLVDLIERGVINNSSKKMYRGKSLATCCMGTCGVRLCGR